MKRVLVASAQQNLLNNLDLILKYWGYRSLTSHHWDDISCLLEATEPDLVIFDGEWLRSNLDHIPSLVPRLKTGIRVAVMDDCRSPSPLLSTSIPCRKIPANIFSLYGLTQKVLQNHPRRRLRTGVHLPGMFRREGRQWDLTEIMTLGTGGMFIRSGYCLKNTENLRLCVPLMGMREEIEITGQVVYEVHPTLENNYLQGYGIEFTNIIPENQQALRRFVAGCFIREMEKNEPADQASIPAFFNTSQEEYSLEMIAI